VSAAPVQQRRLNVLLVDDQLPFRIAARSLLEAEDGYTVVGEAADGEEAIALATRLRPELILMDVRLPGMNGIEATRRILASFPWVMVVLLSTHREVDLPADLLECGALGFIRKEALEPTALEHLIGRA
jgi:two-component system invasion response regulator UvrY